jgi:hypothetical protein
MAALLALAVVLFWSPHDPASSSPHDYGPQSLHQSHDANATLDSPHGVLHVDLDADCEASAIGCCVITHCHPEISIDPHAMPAIAAGDETTTAAVVRRLGSDPGIILPPPRRLPV